MNKYIFPLLFSLLVFSSCDKEIQLNEDQFSDANTLTRSVGGDCETSYVNTVDYLDALDILNCRAEEGLFTSCKYLECNSPLVDYTFYPGGDNEFLEFGATVSQAEFWAFDAALRAKVNEYCGGTGVIVDVTFVNEIVVGTSNGKVYNYMSASVTMCCDPVLIPGYCEEKIPKEK